MDRELYGGIPPVCFDSEGGADQATTWKSLGTSASSSVCLIFLGGSSKGIASLGVTLGCPEWPERGDQLDIGGPNMARVCLV